MVYGYARVSAQDQNLDTQIGSVAKLKKAETGIDKRGELFRQ
ncbi:hypothetical protein [Bacillus bingmayongensis]|nr:hypothetical protein [Bacillus bingmayongensis]